MKYLNCDGIPRRDFLRIGALAGVGGLSLPAYLSLASTGGVSGSQAKAAIFVRLGGGPSHLDTFDLKPDAPDTHRGEFKEIATNVPGIRISEHLPRLAQHMDKMAIVRAMSTREGDHGRGSFYLRSGYLPQGPIQYPTLGSLVSKEIGDPENALPNFVSIAPYRQFSPAAFNSGFLGPQYAPLVVGDAIQNFQIGRAHV